MECKQGIVTRDLIDPFDSIAPNDDKVDKVNKVNKVYKVNSVITVKPSLLMPCFFSHGFLP